MQRQMKPWRDVITLDACVRPNGETNEFSFLSQKFDIGINIVWFWHSGHLEMYEMFLVSFAVLLCFGQRGKFLTHFCRLVAVHRIIRQ